VKYIDLKLQFVTDVFYRSYNLLQMCSIEVTFCYICVL